MRILIPASLLLGSLIACGGAAEHAPADPPATMIPPPVAATPSVSPGIELPEVGSSGFELADKAVAEIAASPTALTVKGRVVIALTDGKVKAADLEGGAIGLVIPKLRAASAGLGKRAVLQLDKRLPYRTLFAILDTVKSKTLTQFAILARSGPSVVSAPLSISEQATMAGDQANQANGSIKVAPIVLLKTSGELVLASLSGIEGTIVKPRLSMKPNPGVDLAVLTTTLAEIRARHHDPDDTRILVVAQDSVAAQSVVEVIGAVRATADGKALYPDVILGITPE